MIQSRQDRYICRWEAEASTVLCVIQSHSDLWYLVYFLYEGDKLLSCHHMQYVLLPINMPYILLRASCSMTCMPQTPC